MDKSNKEVVLTGIVIDESHVFTLQEIRDAFNLEQEFLNEMIAYGLLDSSAESSQSITIDLNGVRRIQTVMHLHHDLEVNMAGAAVVLQLLDELAQVRLQMSIMEKHFK